MVTGATGQVGLELCRALRADGKVVRAVVVTGDVQAPVLRDLGIEVVFGDVRDLAVLRSAFAGAEVVYHLAAIVSTSARHDPRMWQVNVEGARNAATAAKESGARRMVYFLSIVVFDPAPFDAALDETRPRVAVTVGSPYVRSKVVAEAIVRAAIAGGLDAVIVHPTVVIGANETHHVGVVHSLFFAYFGRKLPATVRGGGFNAVAVGDVVAGAMAAADRGRSGESYILGGEYGSLTELLRRVQPLSGAPLPRLAIPMMMARAGLPVMDAFARLTGTRPVFTPEDLRQLDGNRRISCDKAARELGYRPRGLDVALRQVHEAWVRRKAGLSLVR